jgi:biotin carboxyl carrier protein
MTLKEIKELIDTLTEKDVAEFELERGDVKVRIKRGAEAAWIRASDIIQPPAMRRGN